ncbi:trypco2 family protein [Streptomyces canus]|uniref:trypco2 family protein n=1 Tax=Streptomyces canus TaxID=58343 RepID=UPI00324F81EC
MEIELADAVAALRDELLEAAARGAGKDVEFQVGAVELEFAVELRKSAEAKAGFKAWVVSAEARGAVEQGRTHRVTISLQPRTRGGGDWTVGRARG